SIKAKEKLVFMAIDSASVRRSIASLLFFCSSLMVAISRASLKTRFKFFHFLVYRIFSFQS
ncbi:MAG: hypothetical protein ACKOC0_01395, partial [Cytophagales bacterium]